MRKTGVLLSVLASASILVACGNGEATENGSSGSGGTVNLTYSHWDQFQDAGMRAIADAFNEKHENINVSVEVTPWDQYWTSLEAAAAGGNLPDVFWNHNQEFANYADNDLLMDLTELTETSDLVNLDMFPEDLVEMYRFEDKIYGLPKDFDTIGLWYNKTMFDEAGLDYPDETWTWDDLLENAIELTNEDEGIYGFLAPNDRQAGYHNFIYQAGGEVISEDKTESGWNLPETQEAVQYWVDFSLEHGVSPNAQQFAENEPVSYLQSGRAAMVFLGSWFASDLKANEYTAENVDVAFLPEGPEGRATIYNGLANSVSAQTDHPEEAMMFVEFLASEEAMEIQAEYGSAIPAYEGTADAWVEGFPEFNVEVFIEQMDYGYIRPYSRETISWERVEEDAMVQIMNGEATVEELAPEVYEQQTLILEQEQQ